MAKQKFLIDCSEVGVTGYNTTEQPADSLKPYLYRIDIEGENDNASLGVDDPSEANFNVVEMTDVRMDVDDVDGDQITIFFKAIIEFDLDFKLDWDYDDEYSGKFFESLLNETAYSIFVSSNTMGLETADGERDNSSFDGTWKPTKVVLSKA